MSDQHELRLEPTEGTRTGGPPGERFVVGLALFALFAGLLIALGNFIGQRAAVSSAGSPRPSPTASSTPAWPVSTPRLLREVTVQPGAAPTQAPTQQTFTGGIRAKADLIIRANPEVNAIQFGVLAQGALAFAEEMPDPPPGKLGWLHILAPEPQGWVATTEGGAQLVVRLGSAPAPVSGDIWAMVGGGDRFLAVGWPAVTSTQPLEPLIAASADGDAWQIADLPASAGYGAAVSWGPAGWLALTLIGDHPSGSTAWVWHSNDGISWTALGTMSDAGTYPSQFVSSDAGYLLAATAGRGPDTTLWFSEDGLTWRETADAGMASGAWVRLAAGPNGFYAWDMQGQQPADKAAAAYSANARTWAPVIGGPEGPSAQIVAVGAEWVGVDDDPVRGLHRVWIGEVKGDRLSWRRESDEGAFGDGVVTTMVSDGRRAVAFGWDRSTELPVAWIREGTTWTQSPLPHAFGGLPRIAAAGPSGVVLVGYRPTLRGQNPVFWHLAADGSWTPEADPLLTVVADPSSDECGPAPATAADFLVLDHALAVACLGDTPLTFRAWSVECSCFSDAPPGGVPAWLATPGSNQLALSPIESFDGWWAPAVLDPSLKQDRAWRLAWLEVTGHFDDPAAAGCRLTPSRDDVASYQGRQSVIDSCRQQFVVTSVVPVPGP
ncbi:MAG: hypothetical protein M3R05_06780 [Chloroflexota bacterium]|nr:hypothetical protein [Chloroflexota bacterium]